MYGEGPAKLLGEGRSLLLRTPLGKVVDQFLDLQYNGQYPRTIRMAILTWSVNVPSAKMDIESVADIL